jgi:hypothetical protein
MLIAVGWFAAIAWLFQQDNAAGSLQDWAGIRWFFAKSLVLTGAGMVAAVVAAVIALVTKSPPGE